MSDEKLIQYLETRLQSNPKSLLFARLADHYLKQGRVDEAIDLCRDGVKHHPSYITGNFILGKAYLAKGDRENAEAEYKKVLSHDQQYLAAHRALGDLMARTGWENKSILHYKDLLRIDPLDGDTRQMMSSFTAEGKPPESTVEEKPIEDTSFLEDDEKTKSKSITEDTFGLEFDDLSPEKESDTITDDPLDLGESFSESPTPEIQDTGDIETQDIGDLEIKEDEPLPLDIPEDVTEQASEQPSLTLPDEPIEKQETEAPSLILPDEPIKEQETEPTTADENIEDDVIEKPSEKPPEKLLIDDDDFSLESMKEHSDQKAEEFSPDILDTDTKSEDRLDFDITEVTDEATIDTPSTEQAIESESLEDIMDEKLELGDDLSTEKPDDDIDFSIDELTPKDQPEKPPEQAPPKETVSEADTPLEVVDQGSKEEIAPVEDEKESEDQPKKKIVSPTLGEIYAAQGQYAKAIKIYEDLLQNNPEDEERYRSKIDGLKKKLDDNAQQ